MTRRFQRLSFLLFIIISSITCTSCSSDDENGIEGTWRLESLNGKNEITEVLFFTFSKDGQFSVYDDGEEGTYAYSTKNNQLKIILGNETNTFTYEIKNGKLNITDESGNLYIFSRSGTSAINEEKSKTYAPANIIGKRLTLTNTDVIYNFSSTGLCSVTPGVYMPGVSLTSKSPTYTYTRTNNKSASFSYSYQQSQRIGTSVMYFNWFYILTLNFTSNSGGNYAGTIQLNSGSVSTVTGTFTTY